MDAVSGSRKYKRVRYRLPVGVLGHFEVFEGRSENLSEDGLCLQVSRPVEEGTLLPLIFRLPTSERPLVVCARVLWVQSKETTESNLCGAQYLWLAPTDRHTLSEFLGYFKDEN